MILARGDLGSCQYDGNGSFTGGPTGIWERCSIAEEGSEVRQSELSQRRSYYESQESLLVFGMM